MRFPYEIHTSFGSSSRGRIPFKNSISVPEDTRSGTDEDVLLETGQAEGPMLEREDSGYELPMEAIVAEVII